MPDWEPVGSAKEPVKSNMESRATGGLEVSGDRNAGEADTGGAADGEAAGADGEAASAGGEAVAADGEEGAAVVETAEILLGSMAIASRVRMQSNWRPVTWPKDLFVAWEARGSHQFGNTGEPFLG